MSSCSLEQRHCRPCEGGLAPISAPRAQALLADLPGWELVGNAIERRFRFANHYEVMTFVNAVAWVSHCENHHPEITLGYADVRIRYWTHAIDGLSENDFICAARIDQLSDG